MPNSFDGILIKIGSIEIPIAQSILVWLVLSIIFAIFFIVVGKKFKKADASIAPKGILLIAEMIYDLAKSVVKDNLGKKTNRYLPFFGTLIFMMAASNLSGLLGVQAPTSNLSVTVSLAICMFILIQYTAIKENGIKNRAKGLLQPIAILAPLNVIGELAVPISLALRLFGNLLAGTIVLSLVYTVVKFIMGLCAPFMILMYAVTPALHAYFDIFSGLIQTYIFFTLASYFLGSSAGYSEEN